LEVLAKMITVESRATGAHLHIVPEEKVCWVGDELAVAVDDTHVLFYDAKKVILKTEAIGLWH
jgi:hypothetical protein